MWALSENWNNAHARRDYADAIKAADKSDLDAVRWSTAYQALSRISQIYKLEGALKDLTPEQRFLERQKNIQPLVEEYFAWVKKQLEEVIVPPKSKTADGLRYSLSETAKLNNLRPYYYFKYLLTELPNLFDEEGNIYPAKWDYLLPWSEEIPDECRKPRR